MPPKGTPRGGTGGRAPAAAKPKRTPEVRDLLKRHGVEQKKFDELIANRKAISEAEAALKAQGEQADRELHVAAGRVTMIEEQLREKGFDPPKPKAPAAAED